MLFSLILIGCNDESYFNDEISIEQRKQIEIKKIKNQFTVENYPDFFIQENLIVNWNKYHVVEDFDDSSIYEFSTNLYSKYSLVKSKTKEVSSKNQIFSTYKIYAKVSNDGSISFELAKYIGSNQNKLKNIGLSKLETFEGIIDFRDLDVQNLRRNIYQKGVLAKTIKANSNLKSKEPPVAGGDVWVPVLIVRYTDLYNIGWNGATGELLGIWLTGTKYNSATVEWVAIETGMVSGGTYHEHYEDPNFDTHGADLPDIDTHIEEIILDTTFLNNNKINCTYNRLLEITSIKELLKDFMGIEAPYDLTMEVVPNPDCPSDDAHGCTTATFDPDDNKVHIEFDQNYINDAGVPTISIARTIIHEIIHAAIFLEVKKMNNGVVPANTDYASLLQQYRDRTMSTSHPIMSKYYVDLIANTLRDVHHTIDPDLILYINDNYPDWDWDKYYEYQAFVGLGGTPEYETHRQNPDYTFEAQYYIIKAKTNSTNIPNCN